MPGAFRLESKFSNFRANYPDNDGKRPKDPKIADDGPDEFSASINCEEMVRLLAKKGHKVGVSTAAGRYLCEETCYTLEYLKSKKKLNATVLFCHVPPLPGDEAGRTAAVAQVRQFMEDTLEAWHTLYSTEPKK